MQHLPRDVPAAARVAVYDFNAVDGIEAHPDALARLADSHQRPDLLTVAVVSGVVTGVALRLALGADFRVAAADTVLRFGPADAPERLLEADVARVYELAPNRALALLLAGGDVDAADAGGLLDAVVPAAELDHAADALAQRLAATDRDVAAEVKALLRAARAGRPVDQADALQRLLSQHPAG